MKLQILLWAILLSSTGFSEEQQQIINAQCKTYPTKPVSGRTQRCTSQWSQFSAPSGYYIVPTKTVTTITSRHGRDNRCEIAYDNFTSVEIAGLPGIQVPRTIKLRAHALSPTKWGATGWTHCQGLLVYHPIPDINKVAGPLVEDHTGDVAENVDSVSEFEDSIYEDVASRDDKGFGCPNDVICDNHCTDKGFRGGYCKYIFRCTCYN